MPQSNMWAWATGGVCAAVLALAVVQGRRKRRERGVGHRALQLYQSFDLDTEADPLRRLRKCETVLQRRTSRIVLVLERTCKSHNFSAVIRTAEALGIQHLWLISPPSFDADYIKRSKLTKKKLWQEDQDALKKHVAFARKAEKWITVTTFEDTESCIEAMRDHG